MSLSCFFPSIFLTIKSAKDVINKAIPIYLTFVEIRSILSLNKRPNIPAGIQAKIINKMYLKLLK